MAAPDSMMQLMVRSNIKRMVVFTSLDTMLEEKARAELQQAGRAVSSLRDSFGRKYMAFFVREHNGLSLGPPIAGIQQHLVILCSNDNSGTWSELLGTILPRELGRSAAFVSASASSVLDRFARDRGLVPASGTKYFSGAGKTCIPVPGNAVSDMRSDIQPMLQVFELPMSDPRRPGKNNIFRGVRNGYVHTLPPSMLIGSYNGVVVSEDDMPAGHTGNVQLFNKNWTYGPIHLTLNSGEALTALYLLGDSMGSSIGPMINEASFPSQANCAFTLLLSVTPERCQLEIGIVSTQPIRPGQELLTTYGRSA
ncbi:hypothetical protein HXX76_014061 [Chlamydomonas incerta]|uniref:SET domain-containing protein n=1 Tax=Chlamydomonas incerta TaxID=51695 RepID=A0A835VT55_CHLIN|nr:hypothetical protein HXX76_014061 [Chlamydomonas incerta]|eukprot:KAG2424903.1 hypothetical protein HXX76_014061 [Chlamydomonas incerta]